MELVVIKNDKAITSSLKISEVFEKRHDNIIRDIEKYKEDVSNFQEMFYEVKTPDSYGRKRKSYLMNKDGFALLAMGFTGKKALEFKLKYIEAFNAMSAKLEELSTPSYQIDDPVKRAEKWIEEYKDKLTLKNALEDAQPKLDTYDKVYNTEGLTNIANVAKTLSLPFGRNKLVMILKDKGVLQKDSTPYQKYINSGYFDLKLIESNGRVVHNTFVTSKGMEWLNKKMIEWGL